MNYDLTNPPSPPGAPRRRRSLLGIFLGLLVVGFLGTGLLVAVVSLAGQSRRTASTALARDRIGVIQVGGVIMAAADTTVLGGSSGAGAAQIISDVRAAAADRSVRVVMLRINSPGGSAAASQEIFEAILQARERSHKPFVASMADMAASGGYYVAAACDRIVANRATATGSIGVVMPAMNYAGLLEWIRVKPRTVKSGKFKDMGAPYREWTTEERQLLQQMVDDTYQQFLSDVAKGRRMPVDQVKPFADGRILTGQQAQRAGLVDDLGGFWDAVRIAQELGKLPKSRNPNLFYYGRKGLLSQLMDSRAVLPPSSASPQLPGAALLSQVAPLWLLAPMCGPLPTVGH